MDPNDMTSPSSTHSNPAPPIFFGNTNGGTTIPATMFNPGRASPDDGGGDPKRRRIARACDMCRKKKVCPLTELSLYLYMELCWKF